MDKIIVLSLMLLSFGVYSNNDKPTVISSIEKTKKVLLIGVDGLQLEKMKLYNTPNFDSFNMAKAYTGGIHGTSTQQKTVSGSGWTSVLTGTWVDKHSVKSNSKKNRSKVPSVFSYIQENTENFEYMASFIDWSLIHTFIANDMKNVSNTFTVVDDKQITDKMIVEINEKQPLFSFVHLGDIDHVGHASGYSEEYKQSILNTDARVGELLEVVRKREIENNEDWLVMIVTDHGREFRGFGHGSQSIGEKTIFIGMNKEGNETFVKAQEEREITSRSALETYLPQTSLLPTILDFLEIPIKEEWNLEQSLLKKVNTPLSNKHIELGNFQIKLRNSKFIIENEENATLKVYEETGNEIKNENLITGIYIIRITNEKGNILTKKVLVE